MKIKITAICPECADTYDNVIEIEDPGVGMLDIRLLDIDVSEALCFECSKNAGFEVGDHGVKASWEKI